MFNTCYKHRPFHYDPRDETTRIPIAFGEGDVVKVGDKAFRIRSAFACGVAYEYVLPGSVSKQNKPIIDAAIEEKHKDNTEFATWSCNAYYKVMNFDLSSMTTEWSSGSGRIHTTEKNGVITSCRSADQTVESEFDPVHWELVFRAGSELDTEEFDRESTLEKLLGF